jgi:hypothetical protein
LPVTIDYNQVIEAAASIVKSCARNVNTDNTVAHYVGGQTWYNGGLSSVVLTRQKCYRKGETTDGPKGDDPTLPDSDDSPRPSATTEAKHTPTASEAASTTSSHPTKTSKPKSQKTASPEPPTTTHETSKTDAKRPADQDWLLTTCFSESRDRTVFSYKIVQDNIDWIAANVKTVPRNPGKGNCTRLACHRNSAIFFCNDVGHIPSYTPIYANLCLH